MQAESLVITATTKAYADEHEHLPDAPHVAAIHEISR